MPVIQDPMSVPDRRSTIYPEQFREGLDGRLKRALTEGLGLTQFGVNLTTLDPGARSSHRHWHAVEDEFIYVLEGELTLVTMDGEQTILPPAAVGFPAGDKNGHCLINKGAVPATYLEVGTRSPIDDVDYPDIDMKAEKRDGKYRFLHKNGEPYT
jgi:uncharacterized cupin superfamily protein